MTIASRVNILVDELCLLELSSDGAIDAGAAVERVEEGECLPLCSSCNQERAGRESGVVGLHRRRSAGVNRLRKLTL